MQQIVLRLKNHEFRKRLYPSSIRRIWFYETAPIPIITYICEIGPTCVRTRPAQGPAQSSVPAPVLADDGIGNNEFNEYQPDWEGYDYAYPIISCWRIREPISLGRMKERYGLGGAPRGMVCVPQRMKDDIKWDQQELVWSQGESEEATKL